MNLFMEIVTAIVLIAIVAFIGGLLVILWRMARDQFRPASPVTVKLTPGTIFVRGQQFALRDEDILITVEGSGTVAFVPRTGETIFVPRGEALPADAVAVCEVAR